MSMSSRTKLLLSFGILAVLLLISNFVFSPYIDAYRINRHLEAQGIKLLMMQEEVEGIIGKGIFKNGFGGDFYDYNQPRISVGYKADGLLKGRATVLYISDPEFSVYGVHPGDALEQAEVILDRNGFRQDIDSRSYFVKGDISINISTDTIQVNVSDWSTKDRIY